MGVDFGNNHYLDLDQNDVTSLTLAPFTSKVLIWNGEGNGGGGTLTLTLTISPMRLQFEANTSPAQQVTVSNMTTTSIEISDIGITSGFSQTNTCPATLNAEDNCTVQVIFTATDPGPIYGTLTITQAVGPAHTVTLVGGGRRLYLPVVLK